MSDAVGSTARTVRDGRAAERRSGEIDARIGTVLAGRYRVLERLGQGGMATVYRVRDLTLDVDVALKLLAVDPADPQQFEAVQHEVRLARRVTHPNVCRLYDVVVDPAGCCLTMELVAGESLAVRLARGRLATAAAMRIAGEVAAGLACAHAAQVVHRDLKPANVLLAGDGRAIVADFGIAGLTGDRAHVAGTTGYMAPEQQAGGELDARADVHAFGAMLCQMLSGALPADDVARQLAGAPAEVIALVRACLARSPAERPADGAALVAGLAAVVAPRRRRMWLVAGVAVGVAGAVAVAMAMPPRAGAGEPRRAPRYTLAGFAGGPDGLDASFRARLRDELIDAWGVEVGDGGGVLAGQLADTAGRLRASTGEIAADAADLDQLAAAIARAVVLRDVPPALRRPTAGDLIAAGTTDVEAWRAWRRGQRQALLQHWYRAFQLCSGALRRDPGFALAALELALSYDSGDRQQAQAMSRAF
ncbi:MAG TPA: serine/threonine-protein kinase, partial [Kofleriaceae bacterium]|nr:serine/threonine-protein kinase [Kofleriaceae bacterium]